MPGCCVLHCKNRSEKGFRLFRVPQNKERRKEWLQLMKRKELPERAVVCEVHFGDDQFENRREDGKRLLRPYGKPNLLEEKKDQLEAAKTSPSNHVNNIEINNEESNATNENSCVNNSDSMDTTVQTEASSVSCTIHTSPFSHVDNIEINKEESNAANENSCVNNNDSMDITVQTEASSVSCTSHKTYDEKYVQKLKKTLHSTKEQCRRLKKKLQKLQNNKDYLKTIFNEDQTNFISYSTKKVSLWSANTINKALRLYMACGHKGYEEIRHQGLPYPSIRILQHRIQSLKFKPGIFEDVFAMLKLKVQTFNDEEKHAVLLIDEMAIKPGLKYDNSISAVIGRPTMKLSSGAESCNELATHSLVYMLRGVSTKWKQAIGYELTANSFCPREMIKNIIEIVRKAHDIGLIIKTIVSDMGPQNRSWWKILNITVSKFSTINNYIQHPCNEKDKLFITADSVHVFKNVACSLTGGNIFYLDDNLVKQYYLPHNEISMEPIREVYTLDQKDPLKLCPYLKKRAIFPSHFDKMNVALAVALLNKNVAAAILYYIDRGDIAIKHRTTAWFLNCMHKWFKLISSRYQKLALSHLKENEYTETITFFKEFLDIVRGIRVGDGKWKPFQSGLLLCTQTALDVQAEYLQTHKFKYVLLGRFTQDALENLFSTIRQRNSVPDAREFKQALRLISLSQFQADVRRSSYSEADTDYLVEYCNEKNFDINTSKETQYFDNIEKLWNEEYLPLIGNEVNLNDVAQASLFHLIGALLSKIKKNFKHCNKCFDPLVIDCNDTNNNCINFASDYNNLSLYTKLRQYKDNVLLFPSIDLYNIMYKCELLFRKNEESLLSNTQKVANFIDLLLHNYKSNISVPSCHNIMYKLLKSFVTARIHFSLRKDSTSDVKINTHNSRSVAMKLSLSNVKCYKNKSK